MAMDERYLRTVETLAQTTQQVHDITGRIERSERDSNEWRRDLQMEVRAAGTSINRLVDSYEDHIKQSEDRNRRIADLERRVAVLEAFRIRIVATVTVAGLAAGYVGEVASKWLAALHIHVGG